MLIDAIQKTMCKLVMLETLSNIYPTGVCGVGSTALCQFVIGTLGDTALKLVF